MVAARFDGLAVDEIDRASEQRLEGVVEIEEADQIVVRRFECDEEIDVAPGVEIGAPRGRAEHVEPGDPEFPAEVAKGGALLLDRRVHRTIPSHSPTAAATAFARRAFRDPCFFLSRSFAAIILEWRSNSFSSRSVSFLKRRPI